jgi:hypothetical protein
VCVGVHDACNNCLIVGVDLHVSPVSIPAEFLSLHVQVLSGGGEYAQVICVGQRVAHGWKAGAWVLVLSFSACTCKFSVGVVSMLRSTA